MYCIVCYLQNTFLCSALCRYDINYIYWKWSWNQVIFALLDHYYLLLLNTFYVSKWKIVCEGMCRVIMTWRNVITWTCVDLARVLTSTWILCLMRVRKFTWRPRTERVLVSHGGLHYCWALIFLMDVWFSQKNVHLVRYLLEYWLNVF